MGQVLRLQEVFCTAQFGSSGLLSFPYVYIFSFSFYYFTSLPTLHEIPAASSSVSSSVAFFIYFLHVCPHQHIVVLSLLRFYTLFTVLQASSPYELQSTSPISNLPSLFNRLQFRKESIARTALSITSLEYSQWCKTSAFNLTCSTHYSFSLRVPPSVIHRLVIDCHFL